MSLLVTIPINFPFNSPDSVIGTPENPYISFISSTSAIELSGDKVFGFVMNPFLNLLTVAICSACSLIFLF